MIDPRHELEQRLVEAAVPGERLHDPPDDPPERHGSLASLTM